MDISRKNLTRELCKNLGYHTRFGCCIKTISQDIYATMAFNIAHYGVKGHSFVAPRIGVLHDGVEALLYKVSNIECYRRPSFPTISEHIGYILPSNTWVEWDLDEGGNDLLDVIKDMQDKIMQCAEIFNTKYASLENIISYTEGLPYGSAYQELMIRLPIMYYLVGEKQKGLTYIETICNKYPENNLFSVIYRTNFNSLVQPRQCPKTMKEEAES